MAPLSRTPQALATDEQRQAGVDHDTVVVTDLPVAECEADGPPA
jgi:hypothetical protein